MQHKHSFLLFLFLIFGLLAAALYWRYITRAEYIYAHKELNLSYEGKKSLSQEKQAFIEKIVRAAQYANFKVIKEQQQLKRIQRSIQENNKITLRYKHIFEDILQKYQIENKSSHQDSVATASLLNELEKRIQIVPVRLAVAQAILESAWGTSRFARDGNAYFGIHCYQPDCGMPFGKGKVFVKSYGKLQEGVDDYILFLNTKKGTRKFREERMRYLKAEKPNIIKLANSLDTYSEIGGKYQRILSDLFRNYIPNHIDDY